MQEGGCCRWRSRKRTAFRAGAGPGTSPPSAGTWCWGGRPEGRTVGGPQRVAICTLAEILRAHLRAAGQQPCNGDRALVAAHVVVQVQAPARGGNEPFFLASEHAFAVCTACRGTIRAECQCVRVWLQPAQPMRRLRSTGMSPEPEPEKHTNPGASRQLPVQHHRQPSTDPLIQEERQGSPLLSRPKTDEPFPALPPSALPAPSFAAHRTPLTTKPSHLSEPVFLSSSSTAWQPWMEQPTLPNAMLSSAGCTAPGASREGWLRRPVGLAAGGAPLAHAAPLPLLPPRRLPCAVSPPPSC